MKSSLRSAVFIMGMLTSITAFSNSGYYFGINGQEDTMALKTTGANSAIPQENLFGLGLGGYLGYNFPIYHNFSIASEAFIEKSNTSSSRTFMVPLGDTPTTQIYYVQRNDLNWGISLLPNYQFNKRIWGYLRAGFVEGHFKKTGDNDSTIPDNYDFTNLGWEGGIGAELALSYHWHLRSEYDYTVFTPRNEGNFKLMPNEQTFLLGLTYYFTSSQAPENPDIPPYKPNQTLYYTPPQRPVTLDYNAFYAGVFGGASSMNMWKTETVTVTPVSGASEAVTRFYNANLAMSAPQYGVFFGISKATTKHFYSALETNFTGTNVVIEDTSADTLQNWNLTRGNSFGLSYIPGYIIDPRNLLYFRAGVVLTQFIRSGDYYSQTNFSQWQPGVKLGFGYEFALTNLISVRSEYDYTAYRTISKNITQAGDGTIDNPTINVSQNFQPTDNEFSVGLNFRF